MTWSLWWRVVTRRVAGAAAGWASSGSARSCAAPRGPRPTPSAGSAVILNDGNLMNGSLRRFNRDRTGRGGKTRFLRPTTMVVASCLTAATAAVTAVPTVASAAAAPAHFAGQAAGGGRYVAEVRRTASGVPPLLADDY